MRRVLTAIFVLSLAAATSAAASVPFHTGVYARGAVDGITDVPGVEVAHVTKISGSTIRTGATAILPNADPWVDKVSAGAVAFNGNGEMTGTHWVNEAGYLETPIVLTDTLDIGRADDGVISWMMRRHPEIGRSDDVPLPVVAECDDGFLNDIRARAVSSEDVVSLLDRAKTGQFDRGSVGAGTGMTAFSFKSGIGSASRVLPKSLGGYTVGVMVNDNTSGGGMRRVLTIDGVHVGAALSNQYLPQMRRKVSLRGHTAEGSIIIVIATDAPLDSRELRAMALRAAMGMGRTGLYSSVGSGDLFIAFSTGYVFHRNADYDVEQPRGRILEASDVRNALLLATVESTEEAIYDALFSSRTMSGNNGATVYGLPVDRVRAMLRAAGVTNE